MNIQIILPTRDIEQKINEVLKPVLYQGNVAEYDDVKVVVVKRSAFKVHAQDDGILIIAPIRAELFIGKNAFLSWLPKLSKNIEEIDVDIKVTFEIRPEITPQWQLQTTVKGTYFWENDPVFNIGGVSLPIKGILEVILDAQIKSIKKTIEKLLRDEISIKKYVTLAWNVMQNPIEISEQYDLKVYLQPGKYPVYAAPIKCSEGKIYTTVSVPLYPEAVVGLSPYAEPVMDLPDFIPANQLNPIDELQLSGIIGFRFIENFLKDKVIEQDSFIQKVHIKAVNIHTDKNGLIHFNSHQEVSVQIMGLSLKIPFTGKAIMDIFPDEKEFIRFTPFSFELTKAALPVKFLLNLFKDKIRKIILSQLLKISKEHWANLVALLKDKLSTLHIGDHVILNAEIFEIQLQEIQTEEDTLKAVVNARGSAKIEIGNF